MDAVQLHTERKITVTRECSQLLRSSPREMQKGKDVAHPNPCAGLITISPGFLIADPIMDDGKMCAV